MDISKDVHHEITYHRKTVVRVKEETINLRNLKDRKDSDQKW